MPTYSLLEPAVALFVLIPVVLAVLFTATVAVAYRGRGTLPVLAVDGAVMAWMAGTWWLADSGVLREWNREPPPVGLLLAGMLTLSCAIAWSPLGRAILTTVPLWVLVLVQVFRLPLELAMHQMATRGIMPPQMSYGGWNFDIVTGISAAVVALALRAGARRSAATVWNVTGLILLTNVSVIAVLSTPLFGYFGEDRLNVWVTYPPFVWLPAVMVLAALTGHLLVFRALGTQGSVDLDTSAPAAHPGTRRL